MTNKKKDIIYLIIAIVTLISLVIGATYAYLQSQVKNGTNASVNITSGTTDHLVFATEGNITINASADNFKENGQDLSKTATASAILTANNTNHIANDTYNVYLDITSNNLEYSSYKKDTDTKIYLKKEDKEQDITNGILDTYTPIPELYLKVEGPESFNKIIKGLIKDDNGYDITEKRGLITIAEDVPISTTAPEGITTDTWTITIVFKNLKTNQQLNTGKELKGKIIIQKEKLALSKLLADANKEGEEPTLLYHDGQKDYVKETNYALEAKDYSYRYAGASEKVNNYVCLDNIKNEEVCTSDNNLYRIIGLFKNKESNYEIKLIKNSSLGYKQWNNYSSDDKVNGHYVNEWEYSSLKKELNELFYNELDDFVKKLIVEHQWEIRGVSMGDAYQLPKQFYDYEIGKVEQIVDYLADPTITKANIGLMYGSDYGFSASQKYWNTFLNYYDYKTAKSENWLYSSTEKNEWIITRRSNYSYGVWSIDQSGYLGYNGTYSSDVTASYSVRPTFYIRITKNLLGYGTIDSPYRFLI